MSIIAVDYGTIQGGSGEITWSKFESVSCKASSTTITVSTPAKAKTYAVLYNGDIVYRKFTNGVASLSRVNSSGTESSGPPLNSESFTDNSLTINTDAWGGVDRTGIIIVYG